MILLQELKKEKDKAAAAIKELKEKSEKKLVEELQQKVCQISLHAP
jgi:hypothetical protein